MERRLSTILAADMVGYSRLMEADEIGTIERQKAHREELIDPAFQRFHGRIIKTTGDGLLAEFPSVIEAVQCAAYIQRGMPERQTDVPEDRQIRYRIGINLGDVVFEDDDVYGDGVNIAARLETLAVPGGICISGTTYDHLKTQVDVGYEDLGEVNVKNIERPVRVYRVLIDNDGPGAPVSYNKSQLRTRRRRFAAAVATLLLIGVVGGSWWWFNRPDFEPADPDKYAFELPKTPSIAVLPFDNLSGDPKQDYLGDGLTETIIASLGSLPDMIVIARNSVFSYKGKPVKVQRVAEELGVKYVLEGSVQRDGDRIRVVAQLVDALDGRHVWAETYDQRIESLFDVQDAISEKIAEELESRLSYGDLAKRWRNLTNPEVYRRSREIVEYFQLWNLEGHRKAEAAIHKFESDYPDLDGPKIWLSYLYWQKALLRVDGESADNVAIARRYAQQAEAIIGDADVERLQTLRANLDLMEGDCRSALRSADRALELAPSASNAVAIAASVKAWCGQPEAAIDLFHLAMRLEPQYPAWYAALLSEALAFVGRYEEAKSVGQAVLRLDGNIGDKIWVLGVLATIANVEGDLAASRTHVGQLLAINPNFTIARLSARYRGPENAEFAKLFTEALKAAGLPED